jgi:uncharacterized repeat protein (TIGR01451 family)
MTGFQMGFEFKRAGLNLFASWRRTVIALVLAVLPAVLPAAEELLRIKDGGQLREFEVALDEVYVVEAEGRHTVQRVPLQDSRAAIRVQARAVGDQSGRPAGIVLYERGQERGEFTRRFVTGRILVRLAPGTDARAVAESAGATAGPEIQYLPGHFLFEVSESGAALAVAEALRGAGGVLSVEPQLARQQQKKLTPNDPLFSNQWHLLNTGQSGATPGVDINVISAWDTVRGAGVTIGIVDDGLQVSHPDLQPNVNSTVGFDFNGNDPDPSPNVLFDPHGTAVGGVAAARGNNARGVAGVAFEASLAGLRLISAPTTDSQEAAAMLHSNSVIFVSNNSWGPPDFGGDLLGPGTQMAAALAQGTALGRGGRGTIFVWAGGNGAGNNDNVNYDGYANSIYTIAVGAINDRGQKADYSEPGAALVISAPSGGDVFFGGRPQATTTTDLIGNNGYNDSSTTTDYTDKDYTRTFNGTSSATPVVSGVVALILQANPNLGWRDVQEILMRTATRVSPSDADWIVNGAGFQFNHKFGAGMVNASAAVAMARSWANLGSQSILSFVQGNLNTTVPDNNASGAAVTFTVPGTGLRTEHVTVTLDISHARRGDLEVTLISPTGVPSRLTELHNDFNANFSAWRLMTVRNWGENPSGTWTLRVADRRGGISGTVTSARLDVYGSIGGGGVPTLSAQGVTVVEGNSGTTNATFVVTLVPASTNTVAVNYALSNVTAVAGQDFFGTAGTLTFPPGTTALTVPVAVIGDQIPEPNETFLFTLSAATNAAIATPSVTGTILNDDGPVLSVADVAVFEGDFGVTNLVFTVALSQSGNVTVGYFTADGTATGGVDYQSTSNSLFFGSGVLTQTVSIPVFGDTILEANETLFFNLTNATGATILRSQAVGTILDDEALLSVNDVALVEGTGGTTSAVFAVSLNKATANTVRVGFATAPLTAGIGVDFVSTNGTLQFAPGVTNLSVAVTVLADAMNETDEMFALNLFSPTNAILLKGQGICTITNDDPLPGVFITNQVGRAEGNSGTNNMDFTVFLTEASGQIVTVSFATGVGTAGAGTDYIATSGTLVFPTNTATRMISVPILGDTTYESNESFTVTINVLTNATNFFAQTNATGVITNDDAPPILIMGDATVAEGNAGQATAVFTVTLSPASGLEATVNYATSDLSPGTGAAQAGSDYVATNGSLTFPPGVTTRTVSVLINGDTDGPPAEGNETFFVDLSGEVNAAVAKRRGIGTILNDDGPVLNISDVTVVEGNSGTTNAVFAVTMSEASASLVTVNFATAGVTATPGLDFISTNGSLSFQPGETAGAITVVVNGETFLESDETFTVTLSSASGATIQRGQAVGTIKDDDTIADLALSVVRSSVTESGGTNFIGHQVAYAFAVTNRGPLSASGVVLTSTVPASATLVSWTNSQGSFAGAGGGVFTFNLGTLASNAWATGVVVVTPAVNGAFTNALVIGSVQPDPVTGNNTTNVISAVVAPVVNLTGGASLSVITESFSPPNAAFDAGESVTVALALRNTGNVPTTNVVASLAEGNGVVGPSAAQNYGVIPVGGTVSRVFAFTVNAGGGTIVTSFALTDNAASIGVLNITNVTGSSNLFAVGAPLSVPSQGAASVYPSTLTVSGMTGVVNTVAVTLSNLTHTFPADLDILLVGPGGQHAMLLSDAAIGSEFNNVRLELRDDAGSPVPEFGQVGSGTYRPANYGGNDVFPAPAPAGPYGATLGAFSGTDPNGQWHLFIVDDANGDAGSLGGWSLEIQTALPVNNTAGLAVGATASANVARVGSNLTYTVVVTNFGPKDATSVLLTNVLPAQAVLAGAPVLGKGSVSTNGNILLFNYGKMVPGEFVTSTIVVTMNGAGTATNRVTATAAETDLNQADNTAVLVTPVNRVTELASQSSTTLTNGRFGLVLTGQAGLTYVIEVSTNLVHWTPIFTNPPGAGGAVSFVDTNAASSGPRFYRAVER